MRVKCITKKKSKSKVFSPAIINFILIIAGFHPYPLISGSLISPNWVMTAAHCTNNVLGDDDIDKYIGIVHCQRVGSCYTTV